MDRYPLRPTAARQQRASGRVSPVPHQYPEAHGPHMGLSMAAVQGHDFETPGYHQHDNRYSELPHHNARYGASRQAQARGIAPPGAGAPGWGVPGFGNMLPEPTPNLETHGPRAVPDPQINRDLGPPSRMARASRDDHHRYRASAPAPDHDESQGENLPRE